MMYYTDTGLSLTERSEGLKLTAYTDQGGIWTIGYGHTGPDVHEGLVITQQQAVVLLRKDIAHAADAVNAAVKVPLTQGQFNALVDFAFNIGTGAFKKSTLLKRLNAGDYAGANASFKDWVFVGHQVNQGLWNRRQAEQAEFTSL